MEKIILKPEKDGKYYITIYGIKYEVILDGKTKKIKEYHMANMLI